MKKLILMAVCLVLGNVCVVPAFADCNWETTAQAKRDCEEQEARIEYMKQESRLMKQKSEYLERCQRNPSLCK